jgi:transposase
MLYVGIDGHMKDSVFHIFDPQAEPAQQHRSVSVPTTQEGFDAVLKPLAGRCKVTFEVGPAAQWMAERVRPYACELKVSNPSQMPWLYRSGKKNDRIDAKKGATLLYLDQLPTVHLPLADVSQWRALINFRRTLVKRRAALKNQIHSILRTFVRKCPHKSLWTRKGMVWLKAQTFDEIRDGMMALLLGEIASVGQQREKVETTLDAIAKRHPDVARLMTAPGIGPRTAEAVVAYADDIRRFARSKQFACYFGMTPTLDASGDIVRHGHISKRGPSVVRWVLVEAVHTTLRHCKPLRAMFDRIHRGKKDRRKKAIVAVGRKLLTIMFAMLRDQRDFDESRLASVTARASLQRPDRAAGETEPILCIEGPAVEENRTPRATSHCCRDQAPGERNEESGARRA